MTMAAGMAPTVMITTLCSCRAWQARAYWYRKKVYLYQLYQLYQLRGAESCCLTGHVASKLCSSLPRLSHPEVIYNNTQFLPGGKSMSKTEMCQQQPCVCVLHAKSSSWLCVIWVLWMLPIVFRVNHPKEQADQFELLLFFKWTDINCCIIGQLAYLRVKIDPICY